MDGGTFDRSLSLLRFRSEGVEISADMGLKTISICDSSHRTSNSLNLESRYIQTTSVL